MRLRNVLVTLALALLLLAGYLAVRGMEQEEAPLPQSWPSFVRGDVSALALTLKDGSPGELSFRRVPGASDRWELERDAAWIPAKSATVDDLVRALGQQAVTNRYRHADLRASDLSEYHLHEPIAAATLTLPSETIELRYGRLTTSGEGIYCDSGEGTDVWIVERSGFLELQALFVGDPVDDRLFDALATSDVVALELRSGEQVLLSAEKDENYIWNVSEPYRGFAEPTTFERMIATLVNVQVTWSEFDALDLVKYGLAEPRMELRFTDRKGVATVLLIGSPVDPAKADGDAYVLKPGTKHVGVVPARFVQALRRDAGDYRDTSFTRLGIDGVRILVRSGEEHYELQNAGVKAWDISKPGPRTPAEKDAMELFLEELRSWPVLAFEDAAEPAEHGIGRALIEIERRDGTLIQLEFGDPSGDDGVWARRAKDGPLMIVAKAPLEKALAGPHQFRTRTVRNFAVEDLQWLGRHVRPAQQETIQGLRLVRDLESDANAHWVPDGPGIAGSFDRDAVARILNRLRALQCVRWQPYEQAEAEEFGFSAVGGSYFDLQVESVERPGMLEPEGGHDQTLQIGNQTDGGRYARFSPSPNDPLSKFLFILSDEVVEALAQPVFKVPERRDE